jgi:RNA polymerase sigma-70 factor, ECF subfamily
MFLGGAGKVAGDATHPLFRSALARFTIGATHHFLTDYAQTAIEEVNGEMAIVIRRERRAHLVLTVETDGQRITAVRVVANPEKLSHV